VPDGWMGLSMRSGRWSSGIEPTTATLLSRLSTPVLFAGCPHRVGLDRVRRRHGRDLGFSNQLGEPLFGLAEESGREARRRLTRRCEVLVDK